MSCFCLVKCYEVVSSRVVNKSHRKFDLNPFPNCFSSCVVTALHQSFVVIRHCTAVMPTTRTNGLGQESRDTIWVVIPCPSPRARGGTRHFDVTTNASWNLQRYVQGGRRFFNKQEVTAQTFEGLSSAQSLVWAIKKLQRWNLGYQDNNDEKALK